MAPCIESLYRKAISVEQLKAYFQNLKKYINNLVT